MNFSKLFLAAVTLLPGGHAFSATPLKTEVERPDLVATFKSEVAKRGTKPQITLWTLRRQSNRVEMRDLRHDTGEIWRRDQHGNISFEQVFHRQRRIIDYTASDLRSLDSDPSWQRVSEIADAELFGGTLKRVGSTRALGRPAERFKGRSSEFDVEIIWLPGERLPYKVKRQSPGQRTELTLTRLAPLDDPDAGDPTSDYLRLDYADLGDGPSDLFFRQLAEHAEHKH